MSNTNEQIAMCDDELAAFTMRYGPKADWDDKESYDRRFAAFHYGWNAAKEHVRETELGEVCECGHMWSLHNYRSDNDDRWCDAEDCPCLEARHEHLTDADEPQPDHIPDITEMVQQRRKGYQVSDYWRENCLTCGHLRCDHDDGEQQYCNLAPCDCPKFVEGEINGKHTPGDEEIEAQAEADFYAIQREQRSIK